MTAVERFLARTFTRNRRFTASKRESLCSTVTCQLHSFFAFVAWSLVAFSAANVPAFLLALASVSTTVVEDQIAVSLFSTVATGWRKRCHYQIAARAS